MPEIFVKIRSVNPGFPFKMYEQGFLLLQLHKLPFKPFSVIVYSRQKFKLLSHVLLNYPPARAGMATYAISRYIKGFVIIDISTPNTGCNSRIMTIFTLIIELRISNR